MQATWDGPLPPGFLRTEGCTLHMEHGAASRLYWTEGCLVWEVSLCGSGNGFGIDRLGIPCVREVSFLEAFVGFHGGLWIREA